MPRSGKSFYIENVGPHDGPLTQGLQWMIQSAQESGEGLVAVNQPQNLGNLSWSSHASVFNALASAGKCSVGGVALSLMTLRSKDIYHWDGPILVVYGSAKIRDAVDSLDGKGDVLLVPWDREEAQSWIDTWGANELGSAETDPPAPSPRNTGLPQVVTSALGRLTQIVNLSTGIVHPSDKQAAVETLETLYHKGAGVTPEQIRQQLVRSGWRPDGANDVKKLAEMIWSGRRPKTSTGHANESLWQSWIKENEEGQ